MLPSVDYPHSRPRVAALQNQFEGPSSVIVDSNVRILRRLIRDPLKIVKLLVARVDRTPRIAQQSLASIATSQ